MAAIYKYIIHFFKVRITAKPYNIYTESVNPCDHDEYWIGYDGFIYFGNRWGVFFKSHLNKYLKVN